MGRIFCSIVADSFGWHDTVCGNSTKASVARMWGATSYQKQRNDWQQNGHDRFLIEAAKYGLGRRDLPANVNWFSKAVVADDGALSLDATATLPGAFVELRFEMDTLVLFHTCPHPLNQAASYPRAPVKYQIFSAKSVAEDDPCRNACPENQRGFANNLIYHLDETS